MSLLLPVAVPCGHLPLWRLLTEVPSPPVRSPLSNRTDTHRLTGPGRAGRRGVLPAPGPPQFVSLLAGGQPTAWAMGIRS